MADWADALYEIAITGTAAIFFIVVAKLLMARYPVPGLAQVVALV